MFGICRKINKQKRLAERIHYQLHDTGWRFARIDTFFLSIFTFILIFLLTIMTFYLVFPGSFSEFTGQLINLIQELNWPMEYLFLLMIYSYIVFLFWMAYASIVLIYISIREIVRTAFNYYWCLIDFCFRPNQNYLGVIISKRIKEAHNELVLMPTGFSAFPCTRYYPDSYYLSIQVNGNYHRDISVAKSLYGDVSRGDSVHVKALVGRYSKRVYIQEISAH